MKTPEELNADIERLRKEADHIATVLPFQISSPVIIAQKHSEIFVCASQLAEISTRRIIRLTWFLAFLTLVLVGLTVGLLILTYVLTKHP
jgi:hypothetical protein